MDEKIGQTSVIPSWSVESSSHVGNDVAKLSSPDLDVSAWYHVGSKGTLMATLLENTVKEDDIFFSDRLDSFQSTFDLALKPPAFYRTEITVSTQKDSYVQLRTHGISSRADIYLNGALIQEATRMLDFDERKERIQEIQNSAGYQLLSAAEKSSFVSLFNCIMLMRSSFRRSILLFVRISRSL